jgi:Cu/Ag efflux pump CusA
MGIAVVGGMLFATTLTLYIIPAVYSYMSRDLKPKMGDVKEEALVEMV